MTISEFISYLHNLDIKLGYEGERLRLNAPKGVITPDLQAELARRKAEILTFLQTADTAKQAGTAPSLQPVPRDRDLPLSFSQNRLWFLDQLEPGNIAYNIVSADRLIGKLDIPALEQSLREIVNRHEALRTTFAVVDGQPVQRISPPGAFDLPVIDIRNIPDAGREAEAQRLIAQEIEHRFDLARGPLFLAKLLHLAKEEYILIVAMHHIVSDGWSFGVFTQELTTLYPAFMAGEPSSLPELPIQYADFAYWQRQWLQKDVLEEQLAYWKQQLGGELPVLDLPADHPRPANQTFNGAIQKFTLPPATLNQLKALSRQEKSSLFMVLLAAFNVLLHRYTGQEDVIVGSPIANRNRSELENLIGFFINNLVLRSDLSGNPGFRELLGQVRELTLEAYAHPDTPFELLVEALQPKRDTSRPPLFQVMLILQNAPWEKVELPGLSLQPIEADAAAAKYDLSLYIWEEEDPAATEGLCVVFEYNTDLFEKATIVRMMAHFQTLLEAIVRDPNQKISDLPLLADAERQQLLVGWNNTQTGYAKEQGIHQLIEKQVKQTPDAIAVAYKDKSITYKELNQRANMVAHHLQTLGVGSNVFAGIYMERSLEMMVGLLGILKAGGAYVPLDPSFPQERLAYMLEDSQARVLLTQEQLLSDAPRHNAQVVCLDRDWELIAQQSEENTVNRIEPDSLAYVIYTSGSTGKPKGVQIEHRTFVNFLTSMQKEPGLNKEDILLAVTTLSFDIAGLELFLPLITGAQVVLVSSAVSSDGTQLLKALERSKATVMQATPATWRLLLASGWQQNNSSLKILCGGEAMPRELADQLLSRSNDVWNMYGPTETTVWSTVSKVEAGDGPVSIGRPIANTQIYILDPQMQPVPIGVPGELHIGGDGLARGYLNRPELTGQKFIPDPFNNNPHAQLYKTGDLARYLHDGNIEFFGRIDHQVKVRGFRIELGEIEAVLEQHPAIGQAVVTAREDIPGDKRLVAYLLATDPPPTVSELRNFLKESLPDYMVPSVFMFMAAFPLTPNKKVDRRALPPPDSLRPELEAAYVAPQTEVERTIAPIWQEVLNVEKVGVHDNFFDMGGHSLLLVQVQNKLQKAFGRDIPVADMFRYPTIDTLTKYLSQEEKTSPSFEKIQDRLKKRTRAVNQRDRQRKERI